MYKYLEARLHQLGMTQSDLGDALGRCSTAISHRMTGRTAWNIEEMYKVLEICQAQPKELHIFFPPKGTRFNKKDLPQVHNLPLFLTVKIEQPTMDKLEICCNVQQHYPHPENI